MKTTKPQPVNRKQVEQFLASAQNKSVAARKNLAIDAEAAYQIACKAMLKGSLALMLSHGSRPESNLGTTARSSSSPNSISTRHWLQPSLCSTVRGVSGTTPSITMLSSH